MIIENLEVFGIDSAIKASKYPMSVNVNEVTADITDRQNKLAFSPKGSAHDNFLCGILVKFDLTFTVKAWTEAERYHWFEIVSSQSTMHKISKMDFNECFCKYVTDNTKKEMKRLKDEYNTLVDGKFSQEVLDEAYLTLLYNCPVGIKLTAGMSTNYQQLKTIYSQRKSHRLPEWREFCEILNTLPHSEWITGK